MDKKIESLNEEIKEVQIEQFINDFTKSMRKEHKKTLKRLLVLVLPAIAFISGIIIFPKTITMVIGGIVMTIAFTCDYFIENDISFKRLINKSKKNVIKLNNEPIKDVEEILEKGIPSIEDFYSKTTKNIIESNSSKKDKYDNEKNQLEQIDKSNFVIINGKNTKSVIDKTKIMMQITKEIDLYYKVYNINKWEITIEQWDIFIDILYNLFVQKQLENIFYETISRLCRVTLANAVVNKYKTITIKNFIDNLYLLEGNYTSYQNAINKKEILTLQKEILLKVYSNKIININPYIKKNKSI